MIGMLSKTNFGTSENNEKINAEDTNRKTTIIDTLLGNYRKCQTSCLSLNWGGFLIKNIVNFIGQEKNLKAFYITLTFDCPLLNKFMFSKYYIILHTS